MGIQDSNSITDQTRAWIEQGLGRSVQTIQSLKGATSSSVYRIETADGTPYFLRRLTNAAWLKNEPDLTRHEASVLRYVQSGLQSHLYPQALAYDEDGSQAGIPAVITSWLPGTVDLQPRNRDAWLIKMAQALAGIHQIELIQPFEWQYRKWYDLDELRLVKFGWSATPDTWQTLVSRLQDPPPSFMPVFLHRDYHPTNVLWTNGEVSGIVDWINGCIGPALIDVGHCRVNLASMFGLAEADLFLEAYLDAHPSIQYDPYWDLASLGNMDIEQKPEVYSGWADFGLESITTDGIITRLERFLESCLKK